MSYGSWKKSNSPPPRQAEILPPTPRFTPPPHTTETPCSSMLDHYFTGTFKLQLEEKMSSHFFLGLFFLPPLRLLGLAGSSGRLNVGGGSVPFASAAV